MFQQEEEYFNGFEEFLPMRQKAGSSLLLKELCKELALRIKESLPGLKQEIDDKLESIARELKKMGHDDLPDGEHKSDFHVLLTLVQSFTSLVRKINIKWFKLKHI